MITGVKINNKPIDFIVIEEEIEGILVEKVIFKETITVKAKEQISIKITQNEK